MTKAFKNKGAVLKDSLFIFAVKGVLKVMEKTYFKGFYCR